MKTEDGKIARPIQEMMDSNKIGRVIFKVGSFKQKFNTRTAALGHKKRHGYDIYTQSRKEDEVHVIRRGAETMPAIVVDLT